MPSPESYEPNPSDIRIDEKQSSKATPEQEKTVEVTEEIVEKEIEFWKKLDIEIDKADVKAKIEALPEFEGYENFVYVPKGIKLSEVWEKMKEEGQPVYSRYSPKQMDAFKKVKPDLRDNQKDSYAFAVSFQPQPDSDTLGDKAKSAEEWEKTDETLMQTMEYLIATMRYHADTGNYLDEKENLVTICPGSRAPGGFVPFLVFANGLGEIILEGAHSDNPNPRHGVRRVVSASRK